MDKIVDNCPRNLTETDEASTRLGCGRDKYGNDQYMCLPNIETTSLVEFCHDGIMGFIESGNCLKTAEDKLFAHKCSHFVSGCPDVDFRSNEIFKYPACLRIDTGHRCYLADPSCPNTPLKFTTNNVIVNTTAMNIQTTSYPKDDSEQMWEIVGSLVGVLTLILLLIIVRFVWKRMHRQKKEERDKFPNEEEILLKDEKEKDEDTPRKRRTLRDVGSRTPAKSKKALHREPDTPSKRIEVLISQKEEREHLVQSITSVKLNIVGKLHLLPLENEEDTVNVLSLSLSPVQMAILAAAINHVPENFLDRNTLIMNICKASPEFNTLTPETVMQFIPVFQRCHSLMKFYKDNEQDISTILWQASWHHKEPFLAFINPPVTECLQCEETLYPTARVPITLYHLTGPIPGQRGVLKCKSCQIYYHVDGYSVPNQGKSFYPAPITCPWKSASNRVFWSKDLHEFLCESSNHGFVSHQAFAEIFNSVYSDNHPESEKFHAWRNYMLKATRTAPEASPGITTASDENLTEDGNFDDCRIPESDTEASPSHATGDDDSSLQVNMTRKNATAVYFTGELENELQERDLQVFFNKTRTKEEVMKEIDCLRKRELYEHKEEDCSPLCKSKGCSNLRVIDSCWKVCMCHCMFAVPMEVDGYPLLTFPNVCTVEPKAGSVFCDEHHQLLEKHHIPTKKEDFLKFLGCAVHPKSANDIRKVDEKLLEFASQLYESDSSGKALGLSALNYQGTDELVANMRVNSWEDNGKKDEACNKDTGEKARLRQRSRGHFLCVTGGGHITYFDPIFKSESPSQIFMQVVRLMYLELKDVPEEDLEEAMANYILCYDNMCQLDSLKASKEDLPLPPPFHSMWRHITKIIDRLHLANHKNEKCREQYNADEALPPGYNTMVAEQTFSWFSRFKKIANSMSQTHHLFFIHRNIKRRNSYTAKCRRKGKEPVLPGINSKLLSK